MRTAVFDKLNRILPGYRNNVAIKTAQIWQQKNMFSQYDEDVIMTSLVEKVRPPKRFVEYGFAPLENNCLRLALKEGWSGLFIDAIHEHIQTVNDTVELFPDLDLKAVEAFLTLQNINDVLKSEYSVGVMSIDVDGNDYWLWRACWVKPPIVVLEYNPVFGDRPITVPYDPEFVRFKKHPSGLYHGASLTALERLGKSMGYSLVAVSVFGANAFFVRNDCLGNIQVLPAKVALNLGVHVLVRGKKPSSYWDMIKDLPYAEAV